MMAISHEKHTAYTEEYVGFMFWHGQKKNHVTHHLLLAHCQSSSHLLFTAMVRQGTSNWSYFVFEGIRGDKITS